MYASKAGHLYRLKTELEGTSVLGTLTPTLRSSASPSVYTISLTMAPNDLTISGILYEGSDFAEWQAKVNTVLRVKNLSRTKSEKQNLTSKERQTENQAQVRLIHSLTRDALLDRVPDALRHCPDTLGDTLASFATPFRLMELPVQVRQQIYKLALPEQFDLERVHDESMVPALLHVSAEVRKESLPIFYSCTTFETACSVLVADPDYLRSWAERIVAENVGHVRKVNVRSENVIQLAYSDLEGLTVDVEADNSQQAVKEEIEAHIKYIEQCRRSLKLKGEAIFMALWGNMDLWEAWDEA